MTSLFSGEAYAVAVGIGEGVLFAGVIALLRVGVAVAGATHAFLDSSQ